MVLNPDSYRDGKLERSQFKQAHNSLPRKQTNVPAAATYYFPQGETENTNRIYEKYHTRRMGKRNRPR